MEKTEEEGYYEFCSSVKGLWLDRLNRRRRWRRRTRISEVVTRCSTANLRTVRDSNAEILHTHRIKSI